MVRDAGASLLVAREAPFELPPGLRLVSPEDGTERPEITLPRVRPESLAYVLYTSGSTGGPRGSRSPTATSSGWCAEPATRACGRTGPGSRSPPLAFDASTLEIWGPLLNGGRLVLYPGRIGLARRTWPGRCETHGVTSALAHRRPLPRDGRRPPGRPAAARASS